MTTIARRVFGSPPWGVASLVFGLFLLYLSGELAIHGHPRDADLFMFPMLVSYLLFSGAILLKSSWDILREHNRMQTEKALAVLRQDMARGIASARIDAEQEASRWREIARDLAQTPAERIRRGHISQAERWAVKVRCEFRCQYCGGQGDEERGPDGRVWHIDHIVPVMYGGPSVRENLTLACHTCNLQKGDRPVYLFTGKPSRRSRRGRR